MPLKIHYPKKTKKHESRLLVCQGKCDDATKVTAVLVNKTSGQQVAGQKKSKHARQWSFWYQLQAKGQYNFTVTEAKSTAVNESVDFDVDFAPPPPPPALRPTVTSPSDNDTVAPVFYPNGTSNLGQQITGIVFYGNGQSINGTVTQQTDGNGEWAGEVDASSCPGGPGYSLDVTNATGTTTVASLTI